MDVVQIRTGTYHDSVSLMRVSQVLSGLPGVKAAVVAMATELNRGIAAELGFALPGSGPADLLVALRADDEDAAGRAAAELDRLLAGLAVRTAGRAAADHPPRTVRAALRETAGVTGAGGVSRADGTYRETAGASAAGGVSGADGTREEATGTGEALTGDAAGTGSAALALVSVPGPHAFAEALDAVEAGLPVMIFSDNMPVEQEVLLKRRAEQTGSLVMGPDCGTAVVGGAGLGFANVLRPGPVGIVAASGTGAQQVACLLDLAGVGVSHILGVGGRDLSAEVGGLSTLRALDALDADPATRLIALVSKPPAPEVAEAVREAVDKLATPVVTVLLGSGEDLTSAAESVLRALGTEPPAWPSWPAIPTGETSPGETRDTGEAAPGGFPDAGEAIPGGIPDSGEAVPGGIPDAGEAASGGILDAGSRLPSGPASLRGIYSGGTLCAEARLVAGSGSSPTTATTPTPGAAPTR
nr:hypothetical protein GCM10020093_040070 [Planobispora longispora]